MKNDFHVSDVMMSLERIPVLYETAIFKELVEQMGKKKLGIACLTNCNSKLLGILTDGDIRRMILRIQKPMSSIFVDDAMIYAIKNPLTVLETDKLIDALEIMKQNSVWDLPVVDKDNTLVGLLHLHPVVEKLLQYQ